jgi:hypothetical protein
MSSVFFKIEVYGICNFGCPEFGLMGYNNINELLVDCWNKRAVLSQQSVQNHSHQTKPKTTDGGGTHTSFESTDKPDDAFSIDSVQNNIPEQIEPTKEDNSEGKKFLPELSQEAHDGLSSALKDVKNGDYKVLDANLGLDSLGEKNE